MAYINGLDESGGGIVESVGSGLNLSNTGLLTAEVTHTSERKKEDKKVKIFI